MKASPDQLPRLDRWRPRSANSGRRRFPVAMAILLLVLLLLWWHVSLWYGDLLVKEERARETVRLTLHGNTLTTAIHKRFALLEGLYAFVLADPSAGGLDANFKSFAEGLYSGATGIRNFAVAPAGVVRHVYPLRGNENVKGHDLLNDARPQVIADVRRAISARRIALSGPYELRQGGMGLVARKAVHLPGAFWGLVATVIDLPPIFREAGLDPPPRDVVLALRDGAGKVIHGEGGLFEKAPVLFRVELPEGHWELGGIPAGGWAAAVAGRLRLFRGAALVVVGLLFSIAWLVTDRQRSLKGAVALRTMELDRELARRKLKEQELEESRERYRSFFSHSIDAVLLTAPDGRILDANPEACRIFGRTVEEIRQLGRGELADPTDPRLAPAIEERERTGRFKGELTFLRSDGAPFPGEISSAIFADREGNLRTSMIIRDMTERRRMDREARTTAELLNMTGEMAKVGGWEFDVDTGRGMWTNEVALIHDMDPAAETSAQLGIGFYAGESREKIEKALRDVVEKAMPYDLELEMVSAAGRKKWVRTMGIPVMEAGKVKKVRGIFQEITERKRTEQELGQHREHLEELVRERTARLEETIAEIERMNRLFVGRELRMAELKEEIRALREREQGNPDSAGQREGG